MHDWIALVGDQINLDTEKLLCILWSNPDTCLTKSIKRKLGEKTTHLIRKKSNAIDSKKFF